MFANANWERRLEGSGGAILRYTLVLFFLGFGIYKFTAVEAQAIQPLVANSPFLGWIYLLMDVRQGSAFIGVLEIGLALLIASRHLSPRLSAIGSLGTAAALVLTLSFLFTTPALDEATSGFIIKDITLLGAALWSAGEALVAARIRRARAIQPMAV